MDDPSVVRPKLALHRISLGNSLSLDSAEHRMRNHTPMTKKLWIILVLLGAISSTLAYKLRESTPFEELKNVLPSSRRVEGRLADLPYQGLQANSPVNDTRRSLRALATRAHGNLRTKRNVLNLRRAAMLDLMSGMTDEAVDLLSEAAAREKTNSRVKNDLAVAFLARNEETNNRNDLIQALVSVQESLALTRSQAALFNRALILEALNLYSQSRQAWLLYLGYDSSSHWAEEGRSHLARLREAPQVLNWDYAREKISAASKAQDTPQLREVAQLAPQLARQYAEDELLPSWASAILEGDLARGVMLGRALNALGEELSRVGGDHLLQEEGAALDIPLDWRLREIARGHSLFATALVLYKSRSYVRSRSTFLRAELKLAQAGSPFQYWAAFYASASSYYCKDYVHALRSATKLRRALQSKHYTNLLGRLDWEMGLIALERGDAGSALVHFKLSLANFRLTKEKGNQASLCSLIANTLSYLGAPYESWQFRSAALSLVEDRKRLPVILGEAARALGGDGEPEVALVFQNEAVQLEEKFGDSLSLSEALWRRSMINQELGNVVSASADLSLALSKFKLIEDRSHQQQLLAGLLLTQGAVLRSMQPSNSLESLNRAAKIYRNLGYSYNWVHVMVERAQTLLLLGKEDAAEVDLRAAVQEFERQGDGLVGPDNFHVLYFAQSEDLFDQLIAMEAIHRNNPKQAFNLLERSRARGILRSLSHRGSPFQESSIHNATWRSLDIDEINVGLPPHVNFLVFSLQKSEMLIWVISKENFSMCRVVESRKELARLVSRFVRSIQRQASGSREWLALSEDLFDRLIRANMPMLSLDGSLVIIPDKELRHLPFAALKDRVSGSFLIEKLSVTTAPSISFYIRANRLGSHPPDRKKLTSLAVGSPRIDAERYPGLPELRGSAEEAEGVSALFPGSSLLMESRATKEEFQKEIGKHEIVHFAGHAIVDQRSPSLSRLLFAPPRPGGSGGDLLSQEIAALNLGKSRLVVLSACGTAGGEFVDLDGTGELPYSFLVAGVPTVIVSRWDVDDKSAVAFWKKFYETFRLSRSAADALRRTQLLFLKKDEPRTWAGYQLIGSVS